MQHPRINIIANGETVNGYTKHDRNVGWTIAFIRFAEPASAYAARTDLNKTLKMLIVENDCVNVQITNSKTSFAKTCSLTMKVTDDWYASNVNPGDWVFVWLNNSQDQNNQLQNAIASQNFSNQSLINGWTSGLKFCGRVLNLGAVDSITVNGMRTLAQTVNCQAFLELATSIYYTYISQSVINPAAGTPSGILAPGFNPDIISRTAAVETSLKAANYMTSFADKFISLYSSGTASWTPDSVVGYLFALTMGVDRMHNPANAFLTNGINGTFNDAITIPKDVDNLLGARGATRLCQAYQVILGIQKYKNYNGSQASLLAPAFNDTPTNSSIILQTPARCKGFVPFYPPQWDNTPIWSILNQYTNPVVNEMYTALRMNSNGMIQPTLIVREKPLSTGLYAALTNPQLNQGAIDRLPAKVKNQVQPNATPIAKSSADFKTKSSAADPHGYGPQSTERTFFGELPRWVIDESMIQSVNTTTSESSRINFVQVWGRSAGVEYLGINEQASQGTMLGQMAMGNYFADTADISRHGLRAYIETSPFDVSVNQNGSEAPQWARMRADWMFNGHLKLEGSISCIGIQEPICEGDNIEVRGIVYHIDSVGHSAGISPNGQKTFSTVLQVSNGMLADGLDDKNPPKYMCHLPKGRAGHPGPGYTEVQTRDSSSKKRNSQGDLQGSDEDSQDE
jgi:hypothetical protein